MMQPSFFGTPLRDLLGARAISPLSASPWAAMCTKLTSWILRKTSSFVASSPTRHGFWSISDIISASSLAFGNGGNSTTFPSMFIQPTFGSPTISAPAWLWKFFGESRISFRVVREGTRRTLYACEKKLPDESSNAEKGIRNHSPSGTITISGPSITSAKVEIVSLNINFNIDSRFPCSRSPVLLADPDTSLCLAADGNSPP